MRPGYLPFLEGDAHVQLLYARATQRAAAGSVPSCTSDAIDDPDNRGFWTTLPLWNRWRHDTYKDDRAAELKLLDKLPEAPAPAPAHY